MARLGGSKSIVLAALAAAVAVPFGLLWRTQRTLDRTRAEVAREQEIPATIRTLGRASVPGAEIIASASGFRDAAVFGGRLYAASSNTLWEYDAGGAVTNRYVCGLDLPPAPLTKLAVGLAGGAREQELFVATRGGGLVAFDGRSFRQILPARQEYRNITALLPLDSGQLLAGTERGGVIAWDGARFTHFHDALRGARVTALAGSIESLWAGTMDEGVIHLRAGQVERFSEEQGLPDRHVLSLASRGETAWAGTAMGIAEFRAGRFQRTLAEGTFARALLEREGMLLAGTLDEGIAEIPLEARQPRPRVAPRAGEGEVEALLETGGAVHAVLRDGLAARTERNGDWKKIAGIEDAPLTDGNIAALAVEPGGRLWVGYFDRGLDILDPGSPRAIHREDEHLFCVNRIVPRKDGAIVATANGLVLTGAEGRTRQVMTRREGLIASNVTDVLADAEGMALATPAGITFLSPGGPQSIYAFHGLVNNHVYSLAREGNRILAGTLGGISVLDNGMVKASFTTANSGLGHNWVSALAVVGGEFFAGTYGAGVFRFDGALWRGFPDSREGFTVNPNAMAVTEGAVYAGTLGKGLAVYSRASGRWGFSTAGLPSENVTALAAANGFLYIGTDNGMARMPERSIALP